MAVTGGCMWQTDVWCLKAMAVSMKPGFTCVKTGKEYFLTTPPPSTEREGRGGGGVDRVWESGEVESESGRHTVRRGEAEKVTRDRE